MEYFLYYGIIYLIGVGLFMLLDGFFAGYYYNGDIDYKDLLESIVWPVTIMTLIGTLIRAIVEAVKNRKIKKG